ncbi:hypothetical protein [Macrococcoides caseolyticum]|uniref:Genomic island nu Sa alpha2 n=1 Tax=Macrococcoides caseolyticum TaxID=69966 RepID=A0A855GPI3_9STAP|nr:hypothetical protein [Macrococcus caseolyticus]ARQ03440.1 hypothetical protein CA207_01620 [Macrococcus caseolyticus]PKE22325.1 hypothetical protein CW688_02970 [Macrococcus caseolyticus]PKE27010.1 hypothetical protein CW686_02220 [Macrococcus caseolyticus]PKE33752.1 hypothetical protein CW668_05055 [Macrococcus caseolyticus]PKE35646.1 hypothetical protein CW695_07360 [Macrococcus caseolyticus]
MNTFDIALRRLPQEVQKMIMDKKLNDVLMYFMEHEVQDYYLMRYLSNIAHLKDEVEYHEMVANIYHFHFNYEVDAYEAAYYHYWRSLELTSFNDIELLEEFLQILDEPDFDIIEAENIEYIKNQIRLLKR